MKLQHFILHHARNTIPLYVGTKVLSVANVDGNVVLCVESPDEPPGSPVEVREFIVKVNGEYIDETPRTFLGTVVTTSLGGSNAYGTGNVPCDQTNHVYEVPAP